MLFGMRTDAMNLLCCIDLAASVIPGEVAI